MSNYRYTPRATTLTGALGEAWDLAWTIKRAVEFDFLTVPVQTFVVAPDSPLPLLMREWERLNLNLIDGPIGPYPPELSPEEEEQLKVARFSAQQHTKMVQSYLARL
jgi:hypothetical protein